MKIGLIVLDTLRYDVCMDEMESLQDIAEHRYDSMFSTSRWTPPAHATLFTGYYPTEVGVHSENRHLSSPVPTLAERFTNKGYRTVMLSNNVHLDPFFNFDRGFDTVHRGPALKGRPKSTSEFDWDELSSQVDGDLKKYAQAISAVVQSDAPTVPALKTGFQFFLSNFRSSDTQDANRIDWAIESLESEDVTQDFFLFANLMPCHYPYNPPDKYNSREKLNVNPLKLTLRDQPVTEEEDLRHWEAYKSAARYLDDALPKLIEGIDWDLLFVLSDHGELFGKYDGIRGHQYGMFPELVHVPAFALGHGVPSGTTSCPTSIADIHQTIVSYADLESNGDERGLNLFANEEPSKSFVYAESSGCFEQKRQLRDFEKRIPSAWDAPHYMLASKDKMFISDMNGERIVDTETGQACDSGVEFKRRVCRLRDRRLDYRNDRGQDEVPHEIQSRLEHLGYR